MKSTLKWIRRGFDIMLCAYPHGYRQEFGPEMVAVFSQAAEEAAANGILWPVFLRELRDWPLRLMSEYFQSWTGAIQRRMQMNTEKDGANWRIEDRRQALYVALMPVVIGLGIGLKDIALWPDYKVVPVWRFALALGILGASMLAVIVVGVIAVLRKLPDWGFIWAGGGLMAVVLGLRVLADELMEQGANGLISPSWDMAIMVSLMAAGFVLLVVAAWRGWQQAGLVSMGMAITTGLELFNAVTYAPFNRYLLSLIALPVSVVIGLLVYAYCRGRERVRLATLAGIAALNIGTVMMANQVWLSHPLGRDGDTPVIPLLILLNGLLLAGPVIGLIGKPIRRRLQGA